MILTAIDIESLSRSLSHWEWGEYISEALVIIACAGEFVADLEASWLTEGRKKHLQRRSTILLVAALSVSLICLFQTNKLSGYVIGSLGEKADDADKKAVKALTDSGAAQRKADEASTVAGDAKASAKESKDASMVAVQKTGTAKLAASDALTTARGAHKEADSFEKDIVSAKNNAAEAESHLADALQRAAEAKKQSADAESHLADALQRTVRLEQQLSWRTVTPEQAKAIKDFLAPALVRGPLLPFRGVNIGFSYWAGDPEANEYAEELAAALRNALDGFGVEIGEPSPLVEMRTGSQPKGLEIQVKRADQPLAGLLQHALKKAGIDAPGELEIHGTESDIRFFIGVKPRQ